MKQLLNLVSIFLYCQYKAPQLMMDLPSYCSVKVTGIRKRSNSFILDYECKGRSGYISLDLEQHVFHMTGPDLTETEYLGSAGLGIIAIGLPSIILTFPLWATTGLIIGLMEHLSKMNRHSLSLWLRLKNQLDFETQQQFKIALRNNHGNL